MEDKQLPKNEFVREKIKDKPKNYKRIWIRFLTAAGCGIVFALTAVLVMLLMLPSLREELKENTPDTQVQNSQEPETEDTQEATQTPDDTQEQKETIREFTIDDYQKIQTQLYAIGNVANKSIVTITSVVSDTNWFNTSYEREGQGSGTIVGDTGGKLLILTERKVIKDASKINVTFIDDSVAPAELMKYDGNTGLAVLAVALGVLCALATSPESIAAPLPMLDLACRLGAAGIVYAVLLFFGMFGTSVSSLVAVLTYTGQKSAWLSAHRTLVLLVLTAAAFAGSLFGFGDLIGTVYPVYGYLGMAAMLLVTEHAIHARRAAAGD